VDVPHVLPVGTLLKLRITCDEGEFATNAKILYIQERIGMGIGFLDPADDQLAILNSWLVKLPPAVKI
jgi:hypothetical protein